MDAGHALYRMGMRAARLISPVLAFGDSKLARGLRGRRDAVEVLERWAASGRRMEHPLIWIHAPSVGEGLQAMAVVEALQVEVPDLQVVYTWFSPSAADFPLGGQADVAGYLPWDLPGPVDRSLDALRPSVVIFTKTEVWPVLTTAARAREIPVALVAGTLRSGAGRSSRMGKALLGKAFRSLSGVAAVTVSDADRIAELGVSKDRIGVLGDPGVDAALGRARQARPDASYLRPFVAGNGIPVVVAGSTWPPDEALLADAVRRLHDGGVPCRVVLAPHEPSSDRVAELLRTWSREGRTARSLSEIEGLGEVGTTDTVVVDRVGVLSHLYTVADAAYVGGGLGSQGLHSVIEPAACAIPVAHGPRYRNSQMAKEMVEVGASVVVEDGESLAHELNTWLTGDRERLATGERARAALERHRGAARRTAAFVMELVAGGDPLDEPANSGYP